MLSVLGEKIGRVWQMASLDQRVREGFMVEMISEP